VRLPVCSAARRGDARLRALPRARPMAEAPT
jgi:hypothetical protein